MPVSRFTEITKRYEFEAAHLLPYHDGKCRKMHGHTWTLEITLRGEVHVVDPKDPQSGMVMDFYRLKEVIKAIDPDHFYLNETVFSVRELGSEQSVDLDMRWSHRISYPTSELLARRFFELIEDRLPVGSHLVKVTLWETKTGGATVWNALDCPFEKMGIAYQAGK